MTPVQWYCPECGPITKVGEDGDCHDCGATTFHSKAPWFVSAIRAAVEEETERCARIAAEALANSTIRPDELCRGIAAAIRRKP